MVITLDITEQAWEVLKPILEPCVMSDAKTEKYYADEDTPIDWDMILSLQYGCRISKVLTVLGIETIGQLKRLQRPTFIKCRNAGNKSWWSLKEYIDSLD